MKRIILCKGIPASGKSTWVLKEMGAHCGKYKRFSKDDMRKMIDGYYRGSDCEHFIACVRAECVELALIQGYDVILDDTNFSNKNFHMACDIAERVGDVRVLEKFFEIKLKDALRNNAQRSNPIPEHIIESMYNKYIKNSRVDVRDVYYPPVIHSHRIPTIELPSAVICDLDGTLALAFDRDYYDPTNIETDTVNEFVLRQLVIHIKHGDNILFVSGRPNSAYNATKYWLENALDPVCEQSDISYWFQLHLREEGDIRPDAAIKEQIYEQHIKDKFNVVAVYDDRRQVVRMWEKLGLPVFRVSDTRM